MQPASHHCITITATNVHMACGCMQETAMPLLPALNLMPFHDSFRFEPSHLGWLHSMVHMADH